MKKISRWGKTHPWPARFIIVGSFIVLNVLGIVTGLLLHELEITVPAIALLLFFSAYLGGLAAYPLKTQKTHPSLSPPAFYRRQKSCDFILAASTFCMIVYFGNHPGSLFQHYPSLKATVTRENSLPRDSAYKPYKSIAQFAASLKDESGKDLKWKEKRKLLTEQVRAIKKAKDISKGGQAALIVLSVLVALGLLYVVASLACSISCSGSGFLAILVAVAGTTGVVILLISVIRSIMGKKKKKREIVWQVPVSAR